MRKNLLIAFVIAFVMQSFGQINKDKLPIIDMHVHACSAGNNGPPPTGYCAPPLNLPYFDASQSWSAEFDKWLKNPNCKDAVWSPATDEDLTKQTLEVFEKYNIYAMTCGQYLDDYIKRSGKRIIPGFDFSLPTSESPEVLKKKLSSGKFKVFGEIANQYSGISPSDSAFDPYLKVVEELDIPMGIHIGPGPPGVPLLPGMNKFRAKLNSALSIEEALIKHPKLRVYIMHAGWPMIDDLIAVLWTYPQVYVDLGLICYAIPRAEFYFYLKRIVDAGFGERVMFGSDQMNWPGAVIVGIEAIEKAPFLSEKQKRDILYNNAARFLRFSEDEIKKHHLR